MDKIKLSIIIVNWNTATLLRQCMESIINELTKLRINEIKTEIIVVDNGSTDGSVDYVKSITGTTAIKLIENQANLGFAKGNNIGIKEAKGEYIMLLNSDTMVKERAIEKLVETFEKQKDNVGAISPLLLNSDGTIQKDPCYLKFPSPLFILFYYNRWLKNIALRFFPKLLFSVTDFSKRCLVDQLPGAAIMIRRETIKKVGLLDENYEIYFEDVDWCWRMKKAGYLLLLEPSAEIVHLGRQSIKPLVEKEGIEKFYFLNFKSLFRFCRKHYSVCKYLLIKIIVLTQLLLTGRISLFVKLTLIAK